MLFPGTRACFAVSCGLCFGEALYTSANVGHNGNWGRGLTRTNSRQLPALIVPLARARSGNSLRSNTNGFTRGSGRVTQSYKLLRSLADEQVRAKSSRTIRVMVARVSEASASSSEEVGR